MPISASLVYMKGGTLIFCV